MNPSHDPASPAAVASAGPEPPTERRPARRGRLRRVAMLILGLALATVPSLACDDGGSTAEPGLTADDFVDIVVALREAEREVALEDSAVALFAERKAEILSRYGTTEEELRAFLLEHGNDPDALRQSWDSIADRLKHVPPEDGPRYPQRRRPLGRESTGEQTLH